MGIFEKMIAGHKAGLSEAAQSLNIEEKRERRRQKNELFAIDKERSNLALREEKRQEQISLIATEQNIKKANTDNLNSWSLQGAKTGQGNDTVVNNMMRSPQMLKKYGIQNLAFTTTEDNAQKMKAAATTLGLKADDLTNLKTNDPELYNTVLAEANKFKYKANINGQEQYMGDNEVDNFLSREGASTVLQNKGVIEKQQEVEQVKLFAERYKHVDRLEQTKIQIQQAKDKKDTTKVKALEGTLKRLERKENVEIQAEKAKAVMYKTQAYKNMNEATGGVIKKTLANIKSPIYAKQAQEILESGADLPILVSKLRGLEKQSIEHGIRLRTLSSKNLQEVGRRSGTAGLLQTIKNEYSDWYTGGFGFTWAANKAGQFFGNKEFTTWDDSLELLAGSMARDISSRDTKWSLEEFQKRVPSTARSDEDFQAGMYRLGKFWRDGLQGELDAYVEGGKDIGKLSAKIIEADAMLDEYRGNWEKQVKTTGTSLLQQTEDKTKTTQSATDYLKGL